MLANDALNASLAVLFPPGSPQEVKPSPGASSAACCKASYTGCLAMQEVGELM